jgi:hypothetical protein
LELKQLHKALKESQLEFKILKKAIHAFSNTVVRHSLRRL